MNSKVSIIICTLNEAITIEQVVKSCCLFNSNSEVIVVDDGSTDDTELILNKLQENYTFIYEKLPKNMGKSWAMVHGVKLAKNEIILFFDADILNVKKEHFEQLINPIASGKEDMVLGQPSETIINHRINPFRSLSGQRAMFKKDLLPILDDVREIRFGVETFINLYYKAHGKSIYYVFLEGIKNPTKFEKTSQMKATKEYFNAGKEIAVTLIENHDLIVQRIENSTKHKNEKVMKKLSGLQRKLNDRLTRMIRKQ